MLCRHERGKSHGHSHFPPFLKGKGSLRSRQVSARKISKQIFIVHLEDLARRNVELLLHSQIKAQTLRCTFSLLKVQGKRYGASSHNSPQHTVLIAPRPTGLTSFYLVPPRSLLPTVMQSLTQQLGQQF